MQFHDLACEIFVQPPLAVLSGAGVRAERLLVVEKEQHGGMLFDRLQHVAEAAEHMRPDRLALERAGPHPRQRTLVGGNAEMVGPEHHQPLDESAIGDHRALQPRQRLGAIGLLDDVERPRRRFRRVGRGRRHLGLVAAGWRRIHGGGFSRDVGGGVAERQFPPGHPGLRRRLRGSARFRRLYRRAGFCRRLARLLDLELIGKHLLRQRRGRLQSRQFEQRAVAAAQFGLDEAARIGGGIDKITRRAAARAEPEPIKRHQRGLRIAGHRISLAASCAYIRGADDIPARHEPELKNMARVRFKS